MPSVLLIKNYLELSGWMLSLRGVVPPAIILLSQEYTGIADPVEAVAEAASRIVIRTLQ